MIDRKELKATAKMRMSMSQPSYLKVMLLWVIAAVVVPQVVTTVVDSPMSLNLDRFYQLVDGGIEPWTAIQALQIPTSWMMTSFVLSLILTIYQGVMRFGLIAYTLDLYRGDPCGPGELFSGFAMAGRVIGAQLLVALFIFLWGMLMYIPLFAVLMIGFLSSDVATGAVAAGIIVFVILFFAALIAISIRYVLVELALADQPELGALGAIQYSKDLIRGHKWEYFVLILSFLGWSLLCSVPTILFSGVTLGLSTAWGSVLPAWLTNLVNIVLLLPNYLWLTPYMNTTTAGFYEVLAHGGTEDSQPWQPMPPV